MPAARRAIASYHHANRYLVNRQAVTHNRFIRHRHQKAATFAGGIMPALLRRHEPPAVIPSRGSHREIAGLRPKQVILPK